MILVDANILIYSHVESFALHKRARIVAVIFWTVQFVFSELAREGVLWLLPAGTENGSGGFQPIARSLDGLATNGKPIRSHVAF